MSEKAAREQATAAPSNLIESFERKLAERRAEAEAAAEVEAFPHEFDGIPCRVRPVDAAFFIKSGRMPGYLAQVVLSGGDRAVTEQATANLSEADILDGQTFQRAAVCHVLVEPRVVDAVAPAESALSYMHVAESAPRFVDEVFRWVLRGCPRPAEPEKGGEGAELQASDLEKFPEGGRRPARRRAGANGKRRGKKTV
jgi:hypothetical protein